MNILERLPPKLVSTVLIAGGIAGMAGSFAADLLSEGGTSGLGRSQILLLLAGAGVVAFGIAWRRSTFRMRVMARLDVRSDDRMLNARGVVQAAALVGLTTALAETGVLAWLRFGPGRILRVGPDIIWMAAVTNVITLTVVGLALWLFGYAWPRARSATIVYVLMGVFAVDAVIHRVSEAERAQAWSKWVLAAGVAWALVGLFNRATAQRPVLPRRLTMGVTAVTLLLTGGVLIHPAARERWLHARLQPATHRTNILLIILDTVRARSLSLYGYARPTTPQLEQFAGSATTFDFAIAPSSWTLPSHASLFTGRDPSQLSADWWTPLDDEYPTIAEVLSARGYATAGFVANSAYTNAETGLARGFARYDDYPRTAWEAVRTSVLLRRMLQRVGAGGVLRDGIDGRKTADDLNRSFLHWLDSAPSDRPFFVFLNYFEAHDPYLTKAPFDSLFGPVRPMKKLAYGKKPDGEVIKTWTDNYDRALAYLDDRLGKLLEELDRRGLLEHTIVAITSDHGEHLGEHDFMGHGKTLYLPVLHVPLILRAPDLPPGQRVQSPVALTDLPATLLELAGIEQRAIPGEPLHEGADDTQHGRGIYSEVRQAIRIPARYPNADTDLASIVTPGFHYIRTGTGGEELYDLTTDALETRNLAGDPQVAPDISGFRLQVDEPLRRIRETARRRVATQ